MEWTQTERPRRRRITTHVLGIGAIAAVGAGLLNVPDDERAHARVPGLLSAPALVTVSDAPAGPVIPRDFVGFSIEYRSIPVYAGANPRHADPVFPQLVRNVTPGGAPVIRIGGNSTDATWWPVRGIRRPKPISLTLTPRWLATTRHLVDSLRARLILGINLKIGNERLSLAEARALLRGLGRRRIAALEIGNEPRLYGRFAYWRTSTGRAVYARKHGYGLRQFIHEYSSIAARLPGVPLAGPTLEGPPTSTELRTFLAASPNTRIVTLHRYPLDACFPRSASPRYASVPNLLSPYASSGLAASLGQSVATARQAGVPMRIDELNSVSCGGKRGTSNVFASALWALDELFGMAADGVIGVNIHTFRGGAYSPFGFFQHHGRWAGSVHPLYYGLLAFAAAAPPGSRLLPVSVQTSTNLVAWATRQGRRRLHVVLINKAIAQDARVTLKLAFPSGSTATVTRLTAPSTTARTGIRFGGRSFGERTYSGKLVGRSTVGVIHATGGAFTVTMPAASAAVLTIGPTRDADTSTRSSRHASSSS